MGTLAAIRTGLQTRLATISGLRAYDVWPDTVNPPAAIVKPKSLGYLTFGGSKTIGMEIVVAVQLSRLDRGQDTLDPYIDLTGASSIIAAIVADDTLGGAANCVLIGGWRDYDVLKINDVDYMGAILDLEVYA